jgi:hypothetical protein
VRGKRASIILSKRCELHTTGSSADARDSVTTHKRLRNLGKAAAKNDADTASTHSSECSICLMSIAVSSKALSEECHDQMSF